MTFVDLPSDAAGAAQCARDSATPAAHFKGAKTKGGKNGPESVPVIDLPIPGRHLPILSVHAQPATLTWLRGSQPAGFGSEAEVVYLGQAGGSIVVYDGSSQTVWRLPAGSVAISVDDTAQNCPEVH